MNDTLNNLAARREAGFEGYQKAMGRYGAEVEALFVRIIEGRIIAGQEIDPEGALRLARRAAVPLDAFRCEIDEMVFKAGKSLGLGITNKMPAYVTPGTADNATQAAPDEKA